MVWWVFKKDILDYKESDYKIDFDDITISDKNVYDTIDIVRSEKKRRIWTNEKWNFWFYIKKYWRTSKSYENVIK